MADTRERAHTVAGIVSPKAVSIPPAHVAMPVKQLYGGEDLASAVVDKILTKGGDQLYANYIQNKSFSFATESATTIAIARVECCNPSHDAEDSDSDWALEEDKAPPSYDNWLRRRLPRPPPIRGGHEIFEKADLPPPAFRPRSAPAKSMRRRKNSQSRSDGDGSSSSTSRSGTFGSKGSKGPAGRQRPPSAPAGIGKMRDPRAWSVRDESWDAEDEQNRVEEDALRIGQAKDEARKLYAAEVERMRLLEEEAAAAEVERKRLADELDTRPRTYDKDGKIIWVFEPNPEDLPMVQEYFEIDVQSKAEDFKETVTNYHNLQKHKRWMPATTKEINPMLDKRRSMMKRETTFGKDGTRPRTKTEGELEKFPDTFYKPDTMQPPVTQTMRVQPGVVLHCAGQQKLGAAHPKRTMTRKEYIRLAERHAALARPASASASIGNSSTVPDLAESATTGAGAAARNGSKARPSSAPGGRKSHAAEVPDIFEGAFGAPDPNANAFEAHRRGPKPIVFVGGDYEKNTKAPQAPSWNVRNNGRALKGDARPPRFHVSPLGACLRTGPVQPPIGATMGHGLMRNGAGKDAYYFPSGMPSPVSGPPSPTSLWGPSSNRSRPASAHGAMTPTRMHSEPILPRAAA